MCDSPIVHIWKMVAISLASAFSHQEAVYSSENDLELETIISKLVLLQTQQFNNIP